jgi:hypothetical protein
MYRQRLPLPCKKTNTRKLLIIRLLGGGG